MSAYYCTVIQVWVSPGVTMDVDGCVDDVHKDFQDFVRMLKL